MFIQNDYIIEYFQIINRYQQVSPTDLNLLLPVNTAVSLEALVL